MRTHFPKRLMLSFKMESIMVTGSSVVRLDEPFSWTALDMRGLVPSLPELRDSLAGSLCSPLWMTGAYSSSLSSSTMTISGYWLQLDQRYDKEEPITLSDKFNKFYPFISHENSLPIPHIERLKFPEYLNYSIDTSQDINSQSINENYSTPK